MERKEEDRQAEREGEDAPTGKLSMTELPTSSENEVEGGSHGKAGEGGTLPRKLGEIVVMSEMEHLLSEGFVCQLA